MIRRIISLAWPVVAIGTAAYVAFLVVLLRSLGSVTRDPWWQAPMEEIARLPTTEEGLGDTPRDPLT